MDPGRTITTRDGVRPTDEDEIAALAAGAEPSALIVFVADQRLSNYGKKLDLGQKRVILPLLLHFLRNPDQSFTMAELATLIWQADAINPSIQTKVKVAVSRLRTLLGKSRNYVITLRKEREW